MTGGGADAIDALLARHDPDRRLAALFAPPPARARLFALYAFHHEIARAGERASEPVIAQMRLQWLRDAVEDLYADPPQVRRHDAMEALARWTAGPDAPDRAALLSLIDARERDADSEPFADMAAMSAYAAATAGALMRLAARACAPDEALTPETEAALAAAGRAWGLTGLARAFPVLAGRGRAPVAADVMADLGLTPARLTSGREPEKARAALTPLLDAADAAVNEMKAMARALPPALFPAAGYAALCAGYLKRLRRLEDPYREPAERPLLARQARLVAASLTGRF
ncbi:MAG: squalene/phytoene synthase family protein [Maricaulaceae bacterium]|nr:squalene/phytoene synthase family protein [Maricaulaceae bacterium]